MRRIVPCLVLAACSSQGSLEIHVTAPPELGISKVELYVGHSKHHREAIRPALGRLAPTVWWKRDDNPELDVEPMTEDGARYVFMPDGNYNGVAAVVAVGFAVDAQGEHPAAVAAHLMWMDIPGDEIHRYELPLGPFASLPRNASSTLPGLRLWGPPAKPRKCVQIDNVPELVMPEYANAEGELPQSGMIVDIGDPDCDDLRPTDDPTTNKECFEYEFMAQGALKRDGLRCAVTTRGADPNGTNTEVCVAGGATCTDGIGMDPNVCSPTAYCMPTSTCTCADPPCDPYRPVNASMTYLECTFFGEPATYNSPKLCDTAYAQLVPGNAAPNLPVSCDAALARLRIDKAMSWSTSVDVPTTATDGSAPKLEVKPGPGGGCGIELHASGRVPMASVEQLHQLQVMLSVPIIEPHEGRGLMIPVVARFESLPSMMECPTDPLAVTCAVKSTATDLGLLACLQAAPLPDQIVKD